MDTPALLPTEPILNNYFAIQMQPRENPIIAVEALCVTAKMMGILFRRVEVLDTIQIGMRPFLRVRSDLDRHPLVLDQLLVATGRGYVAHLDGKFVVQFPSTVHGGRRANFSATDMHLTPRGLPQMYRGPKIKHWERQFQS